MRHDINSDRVLNPVRVGSDDFGGTIPLQFIQELKERTKRPTKEGEVRVIMADGVDFLTRVIEFAFLKGFTFATTKMEMTLNLEILKKMEKIWGEKDAPGKTWDASKFEEN